MKIRMWRNENIWFLATATLYPILIIVRDGDDRFLGNVIMLLVGLTFSVIYFSINYISYYLKVEGNNVYRMQIRIAESARSFYGRVWAVKRVLQRLIWSNYPKNILLKI